MRSESGRGEPRKFNEAMFSLNSEQFVEIRLGRGTAHATNDGERGGMQEGCGRLDSLKAWR